MERILEWGLGEDIETSIDIMRYGKRFIKRYLKAITWCCMVGYTFFILYTTLFNRACKDSFQYNLSPFWSYSAINNGKDYLIRENYLNVLLFIPLGLLLSCVIKRDNCWKVLVFGSSLSLCIEVFQLITKRGFCEFDDVFHNSLGTLMGLGIATGVAAIVEVLLCSRESNVNDTGYSHIEQE